jgi:hypothetical protein
LHSAYYEGERGWEIAKAAGDNRKIYFLGPKNNAAANHFAAALF